MSLRERLVRTRPPTRHMSGTAVPGSGTAVGLRGVTRLFGALPGLVRVTLHVDRGETVWLCGSNGSGKSTLLRVIATALSPTFGGGTVLGYDLVRTGPDPGPHRPGSATRPGSTRTSPPPRTCGSPATLRAPGRRSTRRWTGSGWPRWPACGPAASPRACGSDWCWPAAWSACPGPGAARRAVRRTRPGRPGGGRRSARRCPGAGPHGAAGQPRATATRPDRPDRVDGRRPDHQRHGHRRDHRHRRDRPDQGEGGPMTSVTPRAADLDAGPTAATPRCANPIRAGAGGRRGGADRRVARAIAAKDLRIEVRSRSALSAVLPFAATMLLAFGFALGPDRLLLHRPRPACSGWPRCSPRWNCATAPIWPRSANGALEGLLLGPADKGAVYLGKAAAAFVQLIALFVLTTGLVIVLSGCPSAPPGLLAAHRGARHRRAERDGQRCSGCSRSSGPYPAGRAAGAGAAAGQPGDDRRDPGDGAVSAPAHRGSAAGWACSRRSTRPSWRPAIWSSPICSKTDRPEWTLTVLGETETLYSKISLVIDAR